MQEEEFKIKEKMIVNLKKKNLRKRRGT